jgi:hypothetical protein
VSGFVPDLWFREINDELIKLGFPPIRHTFDVWHMVKVSLRMLELSLSASCLSQMSFF